MKKVLMVIILCLLLTGCNIYTITDFTDQNSEIFLSDTKDLDTVKIIAKYMEDNFTYKVRIEVQTPEEMNTTKIGNCTGYGIFAVCVAQQHGIEAYQVLIEYSDTTAKHIAGVYKEGQYWSLTDCWIYYGLYDSIESAIFWNTYYNGRILKKYTILK